jgi:hypothetical protein
MPYDISTLLTRNLHDVFGENDPARRRAAIDVIFTEDCVFYEPRGRLPRPRRERSRGGRDQGYLAQQIATATSVPGARKLRITKECL